MGFIQNLIKSVLLEDASQQNIIDAISKHQEVNITYSGNGKPGRRGMGSGARIIQPVCYGTSKSGNFVLRAFQPYGDSKTKTPGWKLFRVDRIGQWEPKANSYFEEPPGTYGAEGKFNPAGDNTMSAVYKIANFNGKLNGFFDYLKKQKENGSNDTQKNTTTGGKPTKYDKKVASSVEDMSKAKGFGDENQQQTVGVVKKGDDTTPVKDNEKIDYSNILKNGPVYKDEVYKDNNDSKNNDEVKNNDDNNNGDNI